MPATMTPCLIGRRTLGLTGLAAASLVLLPPAALLAQLAAPPLLPATPSQMTGPFYPVD